MRAIVIAMCAWVLAACVVTDAAELSFVPGHVYSVFNGGIKQFDSHLNPVATLSIPLPGAKVVEGIALTPSGNIVCGVFKGAGPTHQLLEIDGNGNTVREIDLGTGSMDSASHISIDATGRIYAASKLGVVQVAPDFSSFKVLDHAFGRASGVAVSPDDKLYVTDHVAGRLVVFNSDRKFEKQFTLGGIRTGLDFNPNQVLFSNLFDFSGGSVDIVDTFNGTLTPVIPGLSTSDIAFAPDGTYYLSVGTGGRLEHRSEAHQLLHAYNLPNYNSDSILVYVPEPSTNVLILGWFILAALLQRRL